MKCNFTILILLSFLLNSCTYYLGPNRWAHSFNKASFTVPHQKEPDTLKQKEKILLASDIINQVANQPYVEWSNKFQDTILNLRPIIACLHLGKDLDDVNKTIQGFKAWGTTGTSSMVNKKGDYDFSEILWASILAEFSEQPHKLYPETAQHIAEDLIIDNGFKPVLKAPNTLGIVRETENHILMKEGSRYLKNQYMYKQTGQEQYNNATNGMDDFMCAHLQEMYETGFFEFNANPYASFTLEAIYILHNQIENEEIKKWTEYILDAEHWAYALGTLNHKRYTPFRRRLEKASNTNLFADRQTLFVKVNMFKQKNEAFNYDMLGSKDSRFISVLFSAYTLPNQVIAMLEGKPEYYYAKLGHGIKASPEIYSANLNYLLSAGGLRYGKRSQISPRATTLFLDDNATDLKECFHINGKGNLNKWNNTGVFEDVAVGKQKVHVPEQFSLYKKIGIWNLYAVESDLIVCVQNQDNFGLMYVAKNEQEAVDAANKNQNLEKIKKQFIYPSGKNISYNVNSHKKWVIQSINDIKTRSKFGKWPRFDVEFSSIK